MIQGICQFRIDSTIGKMALVYKWLQTTYSFYKTYIKVESIFLLLTLLNLGTIGAYNLWSWILCDSHYKLHIAKKVVNMYMYNELMLTVMWILFLQVLYPVISFSDMMFIQITIVHCCIYSLLHKEESVCTMFKKNKLA